MAGVTACATSAHRQTSRAIGVPRLLRFQFVRFLFVGTLNTVVGYAAYALLLYLGLPFTAASLGALLLGILFSFRTHGALVFGNRDGRLIFRFAGCWGIIYLVNIALIGALVRLGLGDYVAGALTMLPVALLSYLMQKFLVFGTAGADPANQR
jgi:putative flippase GtrA